MIKVDSEKLKNILAEEARAKRDVLIADCDWRVMPDYPGDKSDWIAYRQALRDISEQEDFPEKISWPEPPCR